MHVHLQKSSNSHANATSRSKCTFEELHASVSPKSKIVTASFPFALRGSNLPLKTCTCIIKHLFHNILFFWFLWFSVLLFFCRSTEVQIIFLSWLKKKYSILPKWNIYFHVLCPLSNIPITQLSFPETIHT